MKTVDWDCNLPFVGDVIVDSGNEVRVVHVYTLNVSPTLLVYEVVLSPVERQRQKAPTVSHTQAAGGLGRKCGDGLELRNTHLERD